MRWGGGQNQNNYNGKPEVLATCRSIMGRVGGGGTCTPPVSGSSAYATIVFVIKLYTLFLTVHSD